MDDDRLKDLGGGSYWKVLLERIRTLYFVEDDRPLLPIEKAYLSAFQHLLQILACV
jgi:hypothetical protein